MRTLPKFTYCGITVLLSNPSRFDLQDKRLLSRTAGTYVNGYCLQPEHNIMQCDVRTLDTVGSYADLLPNTKCIVALGLKSARLVSGNEDPNVTVNQLRGSPFKWHGIWCIPSYSPQDCFDLRDYEGAFNPEADVRFLKKEKDDASGKHRRNATEPKNYKFWLQSDCKKAIRIVANNGELPKLYETPPHYWIYPDIHEVIKLLETTRDAYLTLDIENDNAYNIYCVGLTFNDKDIYVVPVFRYDYTLAYSLTDICRFFRALAVAFKHNTLTCHNSSHELFVFGYRYKIPFGHRNYDTMLSQNRCFVDIEKSLGHSITYWLYEPYHKDDATFQPANIRQEQQLWNYNGKDVFTTALIRKAQLAYAVKIPGLMSSIEQSNNSVYAYMVNSLLGIHFDDVERQRIIAENDKKMEQLLRMVRILADDLVLPTSNVQCVKYFHDKLGYKVVARSLKTRQPSLGKEHLYKLKLLYPDNAMINVINEYRRVQKETSSMDFLPWMM